MLKELSFSALSAYASDRQRFIRQYLKKEPMPFVSQFCIGHGVHHLIETWLRSDKTQQFNLLLELQKWQQSYPDWKKLNQDEALEYADQIVCASESGLTWLTEHLEGDPLYIEVRDRIHLKKEGVLAEIPYAGTADLVTDADVLYDWKSVARFSSETSVPFKYILQGHSYALVAEQKTGRPIKKIIFVEMKKTHPKSKPKAGEAKEMVRAYEIPLDPIYRKAVIEMYEIMAEDLSGMNPLLTGRAVPNLFTGFDHDESWDYFLTSLSSVELW